jgi:hypothetical protein
MWRRFTEERSKGGKAGGWEVGMKTKMLMIVEIKGGGRSQGSSRLGFESLFKSQCFCGILFQQFFG